MRSHSLKFPRRSRWPQVMQFLAALASSLGAIGLTAAHAQLPAEAGVWLDDTQQGAVEIYICQDRADRLCGRIVWLREPLNAEGKPKFDRYNPNAALQSRPICGLSIMGNLAKSSDGGFDSGWIYDPKAGKSYSAAIVLADSKTLTVTGYLGMKFMGKSFTWTRAPENLQRCSTGASPPPAVAPMKAPAQPQAPAPKPSAAVDPQDDADGPVAPAAVAPQPQSKQNAAAPAQAKPAAAPAKPKAPAAASANANGAASPINGAAKPAPQAKAPAVSASPVLTEAPKPAKKQAPADTGEALPWQAR